MVSRKGASREIPDSNNQIPNKYLKKKFVMAFEGL